MKRTLITLFVLGCISIGIFADNAAWSGSSLESAGTPVQNVSLDLQDMESYAIGFSTNGAPVSDETSVQTTILEPSAEDSTIADNADSNLFIWWDITTTKRIEVKLSKTNLMNDDTPPVEIAWSVTGVGTTEEGTVDAISIGTNSAEQPFITLAASEDGTLQHISGNQKLTLTTVPLDGKKVDSYAATLTLTISNPA